MRRKLGLIGGVSPESTVEYYQYIVHNYQKRYGDLHFPEIIIYSMRFQELVDLGNADHWDRIIDEIVRAGKSLEAAGAEGLMLTANTLHYVVEEFKAGVNVPVISIVDVTGEEIEKAGLKKVSLVGTKFTMNFPFYRDILAKRDIEVIVPADADRKIVSDIIFDELVKGIFKEESRNANLSVLGNLEEMGAEGHILGCSEIPLLVKPEDTDLPQFNTTEIHAEAGLQFAMGDEA